jgi:hypothetical protein
MTRKIEPLKFEPLKVVGFMNMFLEDYYTRAKRKQRCFIEIGRGWVLEMPKGPEAQRKRRSSAYVEIRPARRRPVTGDVRTMLNRQLRKKGYELVDEMPAKRPARRSY